MKYISVVIVVILLSWTWCLANAERPLKLEQHKFVEAGVEEDIREFIQKRFPGTTDIYCPQLYTEVGNTSSDLKAHFRCQALGSVGAEDQTEQVFEGSLHLRSNDGFQTWSGVGGEIHAKEINFLSGVKITPNGKDDAAEELEPTDQHEFDDAATAQEKAPPTEKPHAEKPAHGK